MDDAMTFSLEMQSVNARLQQAESEVKFCHEVMRKYQAVLCLVKENVSPEVRKAIEELEP